MLSPLHHGFKSGAQSERTLASAGSSAQGNNPNFWIEQNLKSNALLGASTM
jgi:hypothetical protein